MFDHFGTWSTWSECRRKKSSLYIYLRFKDRTPTFRDKARKLRVFRPPNGTAVGTGLTSWPLQQHPSPVTRSIPSWVNTPLCPLSRSARVVSIQMLNMNSPYFSVQSGSSYIWCSIHTPTMGCWNGGCSPSAWQGVLFTRHTQACWYPYCCCTLRTSH